MSLDHLRLVIHTSILSEPADQSITENMCLDLVHQDHSHSPFSLSELQYVIAMHYVFKLTRDFGHETHTGAEVLLHSVGDCRGFDTQTDVVTRHTKPHITHVRWLTWG